jgi:hypothetical protein
MKGLQKSKLGVQGLFDGASFNAGESMDFSAAFRLLKPTLSHFQQRDAYS